MERRQPLGGPDVAPGSAVKPSLQPVEREVRDLEGCWHGLSILPYRTQDNKIDGVVLALQDIHAVKSANEQLTKLANFFSAKTFVIAAVNVVFP